MSVEVDFLEENPLGGCGFGLHRTRKCYSSHRKWRWLVVVRTTRDFFSKEEASNHSLLR
jgi:hypothetical protein